MVTAMAVACPPPLSLGFARQVRTKIHCRRHRHALRAARRESGTRTLFLSCPPPCGRRVVNYRSASHAEEIPAPVPASTEDESSFSVLTAITSPHNDIVVVDTPASRFLLLDSTHNIHSMLNKERLLTGSYWLIDMAREYFGLSELEKCTSAGGSLSVHIGDAFSESVRVPGGFAGIIVDLFSDGKILPQLKEVTTWLDIERKLMPQGRIMVNCGGAHAEVSGSGDRTANMNSSWIQNSTIKALCQAFPGKLSWKRIAEKDSDNYLALTGPLPDLDAWSAAVPHQLSMNAKDWRTCEVAS
ncbi:hypothetical protein MUK42_28897 [Musa troglodytarum]|uniref:S-adenosyl-L-methionine-dependent methyltransferase superfamily protein n=1 Tax=Musa troglodytarum TaxID=320322 RepID=A0A9E7FJF1_9LILI|nr:hypothetical protein MUK42_28897 [Musa troglodytarum]